MPAARLFNGPDQEGVTQVFFGPNAGVLKYIAMQSRLSFINREPLI
ncbi:MAG: hypothetical protein H6715_05365 [Myxococcales bacterium]|nr:hypothetical protein [Myxococcales bacterium]